MPPAGPSSEDSGTIPPPEPADAPDTYAGLPAATAERRARDRGWAVVRLLPAGASVTMERQSGRLNLEVRDGVVHHCWAG
ncbi:proteinase inhibitor I78 [Streptomyces sp. H39-S7]|uniref:proteinase inhibitor I78 n=1 Tax=Streptomyces sp. H39-S7 TaxID=3004357 RepID=UPI0022AF6E0C|nr:proteinase inhibitor I78 [Streptomyces sp. H39-S7]MCZ4119737.1 proteinase inhibitor I78 [Streptomyces sp. H39-S7]